MTGAVEMPAVLRGIGNADDRVAMATVEMWSERSSQGRLFVRCRILDDPPELPEGRYEVEFGGSKFVTWKYGQTWELSFVPPDIAQAILENRAA